MTDRHRREQCGAAPRQHRGAGGTAQTAAVIAVYLLTRTVRVRTAEASQRELDIAIGEDQASALDLYYAAHVVKAQGTTVRQAYVVAGGWQTHRESLYVACSRSREGTRLYVDRESLGHDADADALEELAGRAAESRAKVTASDAEELRRHQRHHTRRRGGGERGRPLLPLSRHVQRHFAAVTRTLHSEVMSTESGAPADPLLVGADASG